jgi:CheY-like chemotaxis protein
VSEGASVRTVLLVEDNPTDIYVITEALRKSAVDFKLDIVRDGHEAIKYLQKVGSGPDMPCPDLILLDLNVPKAEGIEVLREIRHRSPCKSTPVVIVTSSIAEPDRVAALSLGAQAYFQKPTDLTAYMELAKVIRDVLNTREDSGR